MASCVIVNIAFQTSFILKSPLPLPKPHNNPVTNPKRYFQIPTPLPDPVYAEIPVDEARSENIKPELEEHLTAREE